MVRNEKKISILIWGKLLILNERTIKSTCFLYIQLKVFFFLLLLSSSDSCCFCVPCQADEALTCYSVSFRNICLSIALIL